MPSALLKDPNLLDNIVKAVQRTGVIGEDIPIKAITLVCVGKLTLNRNQTSCNLHPEDTSGIGKDYLVEHVGTVAFHKDWHRYDTPTPTAITYGQRKVKLGKDKNGVVNWGTESKKITEDSIIHIKDASDDFLNGDDFKLLLEDDIDTTKTIKNKAEHISFPKPVVIVTTADTTTDYQILRRVPSLPFDGTNVQTQKIIDSQWDNRCDLIDKPVIDLKEIKEVFYELEKVIVDLRNVKEYAKSKIPKSHEIIMRTLNPRFMDYICFSATLYQFQRVHVADKVILATEQDVDNGIEIFNYMYKTELTDVDLLNSRQRKIYERMKANPGETYTVADIRIWKESEGIKDTQMYDDLRAIQRADPCIHKTDTFPNRYGYYKQSKEIENLFQEFEDSGNIGKSQ
jgi:hypothetical protein